MNAYADAPGRTPLRGFVVGCLAFAGVATAAIWTAAERDRHRDEIAALPPAAVAPAASAGGHGLRPVAYREPMGAAGGAAGGATGGAAAARPAAEPCKDGALLSRSRQALANPNCWPNP